MLKDFIYYEECYVAFLCEPFVYRCLQLSAMIIIVEDL